MIRCPIVIIYDIPAWSGHYVYDLTDITDGLNYHSLLKRKKNVAFSCTGLQYIIVYSERHLRLKISFP